ncbi:hypothetical protein BpHYR1_011341 [Brachionus plicatilis]|uniref:Uncharacterized protein n=1 Tax=Brachionus plicatilis TaxID=10195 RepID=A0A3M7RF73_BRAPC|nr:hypothetical protein BpHYR1_011341 [Brachionus plicatilis]
MAPHAIKYMLEFLPINQSRDIVVEIFVNQFKGRFALVMKSNMVIRRNIQIKEVSNEFSFK